MKEITIISGKGGTGKTLVTAALSSLAEHSVFCDNDVDAADLHLIFHPELKEQFRFDSGSIAEINSEVCTNCGLCEEFCRFNAIHPNQDGQQEVNPIKCEGCRLCSRICPENAIAIHENLNNQWYISESRFGTLVHAKMGVGEENSGKLVTKIRQAAREIAEQQNAKFILNDGPPGIGCAAIASVTGANLVLVVIEPTLSGLHDARRLIELVKGFNIPVYALINKFDINLQTTALTEKYLHENNIKLLGKIPFDKQMVESMVSGQTIVEYAPNEPISAIFADVWHKLTIENN